MSSEFKLPRVAILVAVLLCLLHIRNIPALDFGVGDWQAHGFVSQGYTYTSGNNFFGSSQENGSFDFREIGVNVSGHLDPNLLIAAQGLFRDAGGSDNDDFRLDFANLDYQLPLDEYSTVGVRLGRVKNPFGIYNQTRDVVWTRPGVTLPQSVYFDALALRQAMISSDGGVVFGRYAYGDHALTAEFVVSEPLDNTGGATEFLTGLPSAPGKMSGDPLYLGRVGYQWKEGRFRLLFSIVDLDRNFNSFSPQVPSGNVKALYPLASAQLNLEDWSFTAEYGQVTLQRSGFFPGGMVFENTSENFYFQSEYRFAQDWTALLRFDGLFANINDRSGKRTAQLTGLPRYNFFAKDITFGMRWEFARNFLAAAEYHRVYGNAWLSPVDNPNLATGGGDPRWDLVTFMVSFRF
ncbi:MAG: hypothetical protein L0Y39_04495 [Methylococcaceae bacterium]|nr:hypothetical protein [Methylococcaceae bacterium]